MTSLLHVGSLETILYCDCPLDFVALSVKEGSTVELDCRLSEVKDANSVKWLKDGKEVAHDSTAANTTHNTRYDVDAEDYRLTIAEVALADDGIYDCSMFNERGEFVIKSRRRYKLSVQGR